VAENKGDALTYWLLTDKGSVIARSLVRAVEEYEVNPRAIHESSGNDGFQGSGETGESFRGDSFKTPTEGDSDPALELDLLSEITNSAMPLIDKTEFQVSDHIGLEFVRKDPAGVPVKTKVIEVDDETGKALLEYVHGNYEWVMPNVVQEALLSRACDDDGQGFHSFKKVLCHKKMNQALWVELLWDNNEVTWEPLAVIRKDDPVTVAGYARDNKLLEQPGWKWARRIVKNEKKYCRLLKLLKGQKRHAKKYKFGVEVPSTGNVKLAMELDRRNGNKLWFEAQVYKANALTKMDTFEIAPDNFDFEGMATSMCQSYTRLTSSLMEDDEQEWWQTVLWFKAYRWRRSGLAWYPWMLSELLCSWQS